MLPDSGRHQLHVQLQLTETVSDSDAETELSGSFTALARTEFSWRIASVEA